MTKIVINACFGGYSLSLAATRWLANHGCEEAIEELAEMSETYNSDEFNGFRPRMARHNPLLVECIEALGEAANGDYARLMVVTISSSKYRIVEYDGSEDVQTPESINWITIR